MCRNARQRASVTCKPKAQSSTLSHQRTKMTLRLSSTLAFTQVPSAIPSLGDLIQFQLQLSPLWERCLQLPIIFPLCLFKVLRLFEDHPLQLCHFSILLSLSSTSLLCHLEDIRSPLPILPHKVILDVISIPCHILQ